jgi:hypothetical protein
MVRKHITIDINRVEEYADFVCKYIFKKGLSKGNKCYVRNYCDGYCLKHFKLVQKIAQKLNNKINCNKCKNNEINKKELSIKDTKRVNYDKLICYYNEYNSKKAINSIIIKDNIIVNKPSNPLLICYNNENLLFKEYIKKMKKRMKKLKYKKMKKLENKKINADIKIEYINEGKDEFGFPISTKRKSPFPDGKIIIDGILYRNSYYEWKAVKKEVHLYCINIKNDIKKIFIYSLDQFEKMIHNIYTKETVSRYFGW